MTMVRNRGRAQLRSFRPLALVLVAVVVGGGLLLGPGAVRSGAQGFSYTITVTPAGDLTDGQGFTVKVVGPPGMTVLNSGFCDPDMPQPTSDRDLTEWCTDTVGNGQAGGLAPADPDGVVELTVRAGVGSATKTAPALGTTHDWRCDATSHCLLPLVINPPNGDATFDISTVLSYRDDDPTAGCGGPAADQVASSAPDRLTEQWVSWTVGECAGKGLTTSASFESDGRALGEFADGSVDLAYSAVAPGSPGFGATTRPAVATPVAVNAAVLGVAGFYPAASSVPGSRLWKHVDDVKMSQAEVTALLSGHLGLDEDLQNSLIDRNPQFKLQQGAIGFTAPSALAGPQATTEVTSARLAALGGAGWSYPNSKSKYGDFAGKPLGTFGDYNTLNNSLAMVNLSTGKPQYVGDIYRRLSEKPESVSLITFYLTDLATARQLDLAPVAIDDGRGNFVTPTSASLAAAVPALKTGATGFAQPLTGDVPTGAYPLTFVEYAVTPAEQLLDEQCKAKTAEQANIEKWLTYVTGDGQAPAQLAASGLVPLTPALHDQAVASLAKIGATTPSTGPCAKTTPTTPTNTTPSTTPTTTIDPNGAPDLGNGAGDIPSGDFGGSGDGAGDGSGGGVGNGSGSGLDGGGSGLASRTSHRSSTQNSIDQAQTAAFSSKIPTLPGPGGSPVLFGALAIPLLVALTSATGWLSTGNAVPAWLRPRRRARRGRS